MIFNKIKIKKAVLIFLILLIIISFFKVLSGGLEKELVPLYMDSQSHWENQKGPFISSHWKQDGPYSAYAPGKALLGCWSVAFAQVLAFHQLLPCGDVTYNTSKGVKIDETFNSSVNWSKIVPWIDSLTSLENSAATATYCYQAAVVLQKDFGTGEYRYIESVPSEVSEHYRCKVEKIANDPEIKIRSELNAGFPVIVYFDDILSIRIVKNGHAVVFDGIANDKEITYVHVNFGWAGICDGWYNLRDIARERELLYIFSIRP